MKNKLELKDIAGYLPYGLKVALIDNGISKTKHEIFFKDSLSAISRTKIKFSYFINYKPEDSGFNIEYKPILRPMSDLKSKSLGYAKDYGTMSDAINFHGFTTDDVLFDPTDNIIFLSDLLKDLDFFYKNHFDINGLIQKGLAVSIHDLK